MLSELQSRPGMRLLLGALSIPYAAVIHARNRRFDRRGPNLRLPIPVISVGNIIVGGTGKTPMVLAILDLLKELGRQSAVVARGYGAAPGTPNDEELLVRRRYPDVIYVADADRCRGSQTAQQKHGADVIVLDDGFQHRALGRDLDLVLIDALCPFSNDRLLPRGLLREPIRSLARADAVIITRCNQVDDQRISEIEGRVREHLGGRPILRARHRVDSLEPLGAWISPQKLQQSIHGRGVAAFAGIGRPEAFEQTLRDFGVEPIAHHWFPDHHRYDPKDLRQLQEEFRQCDWLITTEKDAVKLAFMDVSNVRIAVLRVTIDFDDESRKMLRSLVEAVVFGRGSSGGP